MFLDQNPYAQEELLKWMENGEFSPSKKRGHSSVGWLGVARQEGCERYESPGCGGAPCVVHLRPGPSREASNR